MMVESALRLLSQLGSLDAFLVERLIRPFHVLGSALAVLVAVVGWLSGLAMLGQLPIAGLVVIAVTTLLAGLVFIGVRIVAEAVIAVFRMHARFVGGGPWDRIPD
jgi:hypothetical protein